MKLTSAQTDTLAFLEILGVRVVDTPPPAGSYMAFFESQWSAKEAGLITEAEFADSLERRMRAQCGED